MDWQPIETLTCEDGFVLGYTSRDDECRDREYFMGCKYDMRTNALINQWTGRWKCVSHWLPLPAAPVQS